MALHSHKKKVAPFHSRKLFVVTIRTDQSPKETKNSRELSTVNKVHHLSESIIEHRRVVIAEATKKLIISMKKKNRNI
jgi:hypothetical protein